MPLWRVLAVALALVAYALGSGALMAYAPEHPWSVAVLFGPLLGAFLLGGLLKRHVPTLALGGAATAAVVAVAWNGGASVQWLYMAQHAAIHASLAYSFGLTLRPGSTPLITLLAQQVHTVFTPAMRAYTGALTRFWVGFFVAMIGLSLVIFLLAPWPLWSLFCTVLTPAAAGAVFVAEYFWRYWRHPEFERISLATAAQAYRRFNERRSATAASPLPPPAH
jgi:uncharacterized membrane protein